MSDWGRIHRHLYKHPKVEQVSLAAMGLWTLCNSWCRDNRKAGFIPDDCPLLVGNARLVNELIDAGLWEAVEGGFRFHDWEEHNGDTNPKTTPARLVYEAFGGRYPKSVERSLIKIVEGLLDEGQEKYLIREALKLWSERENAQPGLLPFLVVDAIRTSKNSNVVKLIKEALNTHDITPLRRYGYWFEYPSAPLSLTNPQDVTAFMIAAQREWLLALQKELDW